MIFPNNHEICHYKKLSDIGLTWKIIILNIIDLDVVKTHQNLKF
jgi:hypothetical protein